MNPTEQKKKHTTVVQQLEQSTANALAELERTVPNLIRTAVLGTVRAGRRHEEASQMSDGTVGDLVKKLRKMHGHLSAKDRETCAMAIAAVTELSMRLYRMEFEHANPQTHEPAEPVHEALGHA